ncbi:peptide ABC transporter substrate-binding protein [Lactobacillus crispatus]|jgi:oligopeptide ABC transporter substrate binding protein|uniref:peptide ABC transporter substrate-binding protein n=1 Tax=Lactobacillus crispatus TaxID=47770 RepID=UPI0018E34560|nr:peptide ABC transporter substrate-binding protein [Lactobacillus crispatus]MBI1717536.1 peptide ABC transporter substrate-binding protein [Lactobacillus crispatus]MCZ3847393.1 peptide ABC transporter substrate-binding protein [Lactobacillus crispatus]MCZ3849655.1 peptide ABC transporter substrate-binding protein [Lactobacillus crispatus]MCZ3855571.1 peptide ABC transporter substrate-binding protein [Lactobacillus crispatus]MCZ3857817.1 peptide ABC transporter substrate-binding protein [Lact
MSKLKGVLAGVVTISLGMLLAACGNGNSSSKSAAQSGTLNLSTTAPLDTIDISKSTGFGQTGNVFESFYRLGKNGKPTAGLAKTGTVSKDGKTWTFKIRDSKWSNGDPIVAQDFVYSWRRSLNPKTASPYAYLFSGVKNADAIIAGKKSPNALGISAPDKKTVVVKLNRPIAYFRVLMAYPLFGPQNEKVVKKYGNRYATKAQYQVYSGPFKIKGWNGTNDTWSFVKNNDYWDKKVVKLNKIHYQVVKSNNTGYQLYQQGKLDLTPLSSEQVKNLKSNNDFTQYPYSLVRFLLYNFKDKNAVNRKALNNKNIRLALSLSIDRDIVTKKVLGNGSTLPKGFVANDLAANPKTGIDFAKEQAVKNTVDYNPALAKKYWQKGLQEIGQKSLTFDVLSSNDEADSDQLTQYLQSQWTKELKGIKINITNIPDKSTTSRAHQGNFDIYLSHWGGDFNDPMTFMQIPMTGTSYNYGKWSNSEYDNLVKKAGNQDANNPDIRWNDLISAAKIVNSNQAITPIYQQTTAYLQNKRVHGIIHNTAGTQWSYKYAYVD